MTEAKRSVVFDSSALTHQQTARAESLLIARQIVGARPHAPEAYPPTLSPDDLVAVAEFILYGPAAANDELRTLSGQVVDSSWAAGIPTPVDPAPGERSPF